MKEIWDSIGLAIVILAICLGFGQCTKMVKTSPETEKERVCKYYSDDVENYNVCSMKFN